MNHIHDRSRLDAGDDFALMASDGARRGPDEVARLYAALDLVTALTNPRTADLLDAGLKRMAQKLFEEAGEVAIEATRRRRHAVVRESADLLYHLVVLWRACGIAPDDVWGEMRWRAETFGLAEKRPKKTPDHASDHPSNPDRA